MSFSSIPEAWAMATDVNYGGGGFEAIRGGAPGAGAAYRVELHYVYGKIIRIDEASPELAAVGHYLYSTMDSIAERYLQKATIEVFERFARLEGAWDDKRVWREAKKERVYWLAQVALVERRRARFAWSPERVGGEVAARSGLSFSTRNWSQDWRRSWQGIARVINDCECDLEKSLSF